MPELDHVQASFTGFVLADKRLWNVQLGCDLHLGQPRLKAQVA